MVAKRTDDPAELMAAATAFKLAEAHLNFNYTLFGLALPLSCGPTSSSSQRIK
jgi:hypothetical protein